MPIIRLSPLLLILSLFTSPDSMAEPTQSELDQRCEEARQLLLKPLRETKIERCMEQKRNSPDYCRRYWSDYGEAAGSGKWPGGNTPRLFDDIPECIAAREARNLGTARRDSGNDSPGADTGKGSKKVTYDDNTVDRTSNDSKRDRSSTTNTRDRTSSKGYNRRDSDPKKSRDRTSTDGISDR